MTHTRRRREEVRGKDESSDEQRDVQSIFSFSEVLVKMTLTHFSLISFNEIGNLQPFIVLQQSVSRSFDTVMLKEDILCFLSFPTKKRKSNKRVAMYVTYLPCLHICLCPVSMCFMSVKSLSPVAFMCVQATRMRKGLIEMPLRKNSQELILAASG